MKKLFDLRGRMAVVTGGMGQLGAQYAIALADQGAKVALFDLPDSPGKGASMLGRYFRTGKVQLFPVDITDRKDLSAVAAKLVKTWGCPHILVNNAGVDSPPNAPADEVGPFETYPEESFDHVMNVNTKGTYLCCQVIGGLMAKAGRGSIINIASIYGMLSPCQDIYEFRRKKGGVFFKPVAYSVSKSAIYNLTRYLATSWAKKGVRVNTLTLSGVFNSQPKEFLRAYCARMPMGRMARPDEMNGAVVFLASDASSYMTGSNMVVDGGWSAW